MNATNSLLRSIRLPRLFLILLVILPVLILIGGAALDRWSLAATFFLMGEYTLMTESQPSDREVIKVFGENSGAFEQLRQMALEDGSSGEVLRIDNRGSNDIFTGRSDLSISRQSEYLRLLSSIRPSPVILVIPNHSVDFSLASGGLGPLGVDWNKGIRYIPDNPEKEGLILKDLDKAKKGDGDELLRQIDEHWFLYYESY